MDFSHPTYLQIFLTASLPIMGLAYALVGGLKLSLVDRLQIDEGKVGRLVGGFGTMFGPTILLCGFLTDSVGRKGVWLAGSIAVAAAILILARTRTYRGALAAVVLLGIGWAAQVNVSNVLMRVAVPSDAPREQLVWATNFFDFVFGAGAFVTPMVLALILRTLGYSRGLLLLAILATAPVVLGVFAEMQPPPTATRFRPGPTRSRRRRPQADRRRSSPARSSGCLDSPSSSSCRWKRRWPGGPRRWSFDRCRRMFQSHARSASAR